MCTRKLKPACDVSFAIFLLCNVVKSPQEQKTKRELNEIAKEVRQRKLYNLSKKLGEKVWQFTTKADQPPMMECRLKDALNALYEKFLLKKQLEETRLIATNSSVTLIPSSVYSSAKEKLYQYSLLQS